ncbi:Uncharacterised protein [Escherichia coli]|nr:Uncharacterised protein [Escherichia coli]CTY50941.1 Uncharacterised protein [Escherichia coli]CTZ41137.1 Uncharacterised protein [Escherichia coli]CUA54885.1 Uncharacterised protein [Escherichia coli]
MKNNSRMKVHHANPLPTEIFNCIQITVKIGTSSPMVLSIYISMCNNS